MYIWVPSETILDEEKNLDLYHRSYIFNQRKQINPTKNPKIYPAHQIL
jgi:hypothetical protein